MLNSESISTKYRILIRLQHNNIFHLKYSQCEFLFIIWIAESISSSPLHLKSGYIRSVDTLSNNENHKSRVETLKIPFEQKIISHSPYSERNPGPIEEN